MQNHHSKHNTYARNAIIVYSMEPFKSRLRAVSLFLESPWERTQNKYACERDCERDFRAAMAQAGSSVGIGRRPTPTLLAARGISAPTLTCFAFFPRIVEEMRDCLQSIANLAKYSPEIHYSS